MNDKIALKNQEVRIEKCRECSHLMVNLDVDQLAPGDLVTLKQAKVRISNPATDKAVCVDCEYRTFGRKVADWFGSDNDDDSSFFSSGSFSGRRSSGGFGGFGGGSFGGFGGGSFGGGGVSRGF